MANIDTTIEIEEAYIKDKLTYKKKRSRKTTYFYDIQALGGNNEYTRGKFVVALVYPFNYNATPWTSNKPEFSISWGDGTETIIRNEHINMFSLHYDKISKYNKIHGVKDIKLRPVVEKLQEPSKAKALLYHEYDIDGSYFTINSCDTMRISITSDEIVVPVAINMSHTSHITDYITDGNLLVPFIDEDNYNYSNRGIINKIHNSISNIAITMGGEYPMNCIGLPTEEYRKDFSRVFERGIYHPLDQKIAHIRVDNQFSALDNEIMTTFNRNNRTEEPDYKSPGSMSSYALAGNNPFVMSDLLRSLNTPATREAIPIQAMLCSGVYDYFNSSNLYALGHVINPLLAPALINKGVHVNNSLLYVTIISDDMDSNETKVHFVKNPFYDIREIYPDKNNEIKMFANIQNDEVWGFFCNFYIAHGWRVGYKDNREVTQVIESPWIHGNKFYNLLKSVPTKVKKMKCIYRNGQSPFLIGNKHKLLDAVPKTVEEIENLVMFSDIEFYKKGFRVYREKSEYNDLEAYEGGFRMLMFDNDDGVSPKYKNSKLRVIKNMVFCCDLYPEPLRLGDNAWTTNFDGVSLLYGFNNLEKVDGVFTYCRFKDTGYMRIRDICQRPEKSKYENPAEIEFKQIDLSRVMHWCDVINELAEDGDSNEHALNPFNGHMEKKQRSSWNNTPSYKMRDFFNKMTGDKVFDPNKLPTFIFGKQENDADLKHMCLGFLFLERKPYPNDRLGGNVDQTPIFKSVTDFAHGYMMSYSYFNCEGNLVPVKTIKTDGYIQQFYNHQLIQKFFNELANNFSQPRNSYQRTYYTGVINPQWISPIGWMLAGKSIFDNRKLNEDLKNAVLNRFKSAILDMSNIEGLFANVGALACDLTCLSEINDIDLFLDFNAKVNINGNIKNVHVYSNRFGLYSYNEDDVLIKSDKDINIKRLFQNETYYGALTTDNFFQAKSKYRNWFTDTAIYDDNELNKIRGFEHGLSYSMTTFKRYNDFVGSDYKDRLISMGCPRVSPYDIPVWSDPASGEFEFSFTRYNSALGSNERFKSSTTWAHDDNLLNWIFPPLITGYKYRYVTLYEYINATFKGDSSYATRFTMNTQYPRGNQGANLLLAKGKFIVNTNNSSTNADYAFDFTNLKHVIPKRIVHNLEEFNEMVAMRINEFNSYERYPGRINSMIVPKVASTPARYRKFDNVQYKFKSENVELEEFNYMPHNVVDYTIAMPNTYQDAYDMVFGVSHVRKLFPDDVNVHIKNFKMPYVDNINKFKMLGTNFDITKDKFIMQTVPLDYALNGATVDNIEELRDNWNYKGTATIFKSAKMIDGPLNQTATVVLRCPYNVDLSNPKYNVRVFVVAETDWGREKVNEQNLMVNPQGTTPVEVGNPDLVEFYKVCDTTAKYPQSIKVTNFQPPLRMMMQFSNLGTLYQNVWPSKSINQDYWSVDDRPGKFLFPRSTCDQHTAHVYAQNTADENFGGTSRWVNQLPKEIHKCVVIRKFVDRMEFDLTRKETEFSILVLADIPLWMEGSDYITGEFPPYSDYSEKYPEFKRTFDADWFKTQCYDKQMKGFEIDDVFLEVDDHMRHTMALMQIDNNDLNIPHRVNPHILEPTTRKGQTKFGEVITAYGRKFPIVNFRWTLGFAFDNLPKTVTEVEGFNFADTVYVPDKCVPAQIIKFHFHKELLEPNQAYKQGIMDAVLWFNKPFMNDNIQTPGSVEYFSNIMLFTRRKDSLSNGARTQMEEYYEWSTDNKITLGPNVYNEGYGSWKDSIRVSGLRSGRELCLATHIAPEPNYYEMRRNYNSWIVADRNVKPDDIITVKWVIRFQSLIALPIANTWVYDNNLANLNPYISGGVGHFDMSEDTVTYTGKAKDLINFGVFDYDKIQNVQYLYRQNGLATIKSIRIYSDVYVCPSINWERGIWGVLRGTLPSGTDTRCVPIPQKCYEGIFYRDVKLHGIITGEYDGSLPEKLFWGTRPENLRIQGLYCSTRYANPHSWRTRKTCIRKQLANNTSQGDRYQINNLSRLRESGKIVTDNFGPTLDNIFISDSQHHVYNRITGNNLFVNARYENVYNGSVVLGIFPMVTSDQDSDYRSSVDEIHNIQYTPISDQMIKDNTKYYPRAMFYMAGFADRFNYLPSFKLNSPVVDAECEIEYSLNFSRGAFSNVHDASPLSIPHKIDELDVSYLGGFADLFEVYTDDVFGFTEPNLYNLNYPINMHQHQEYAYTGFKYPDHTNNGGLWDHYVRPSYQAMPVSSFFSKWFFLNGTIRVKDNSEAYVFSDHRIGNITDFDGYSPHRFDQTTFDQSIYAVQHENVRRSKIYKINNISLRMPGSSGHFYTSDYMSVDNNYYNKIVKPKLESSGWYPYCVCTAVTHGGFGSIERYSRSSVYYPSNMISETVGAIDQTGYVPIMSSLMKLNMLKSHRDLICRTDTAWYSTIPFECMVPQGYMNNWAVADDNTMKCRAYFSLIKKMRDFPDVGIMVPPKWYKDHQNNNKLPNYVDRFKYIEDIQNNKGLLVSTIMCEPSKNMMFRMNGKRRIKARYGRLRFVEIGNGWTGMDLGDWTTQPYDIIYPRAIPGIVGIYHYVNSAYRGRITNMRNLCHWACYGFNYGLIDDTGMTQYLDIGRELFIESETAFARNQMLIGCHPHLKEVKIINAACSEMSTAYNDYYDTEKLDPDTNVKLHLVDESQHPSFLQTSPNCIIKETLPYQPCLTKIKNMCSSPLFLTVGNTSLTHILNYGSRIMHGRKYGKSPTVWSYLIGEEQKVHSNANVMRTCIWPTYKKSNYVWTPSFTLDPSSQVSSYVDVIVDPKWVDRTMYARQDLPKEQQTPYQGIKIQGMFMGVWNNVETTAFGGIPGVEKATNKFWDRLIPGIGSTAYRVNYSSGRALEYGVNEIINLHTRGITRRGLWNVPMQNWGKGVEQISLPTTQFLRSNSGLPGPANFRASGNPNHHPDLKVFLTHTFAEYWFATVNPVDLYTLCDSTILTNNGLPDPANDGIIIADDYRFLDIYGQPFTVTYGNQSPVVYAKSQRGWIRSPDNLFYLEGWDMSTNNLPTNTNKTLIRLYEADSDITDFYSTAITRNYNHRSDMAKQSYYAAYTNPAQALQKFEESVVSFVKPSYPPTARLNITNAFNGIRFRWFNYDLSKPGYSSTLAKYKFNTANYVRDNFDRIFFNGKVNIIGKSGITS